MVQRRFVWGAFFCGALMTPWCHAQEAVWPAKPVTFVVGFPPGTATDSVGRVLAERFSTRLGNPL